MSLAQIPVAFAAGFVSFLAPCVLPLVPGYLSAVSAVEADRLGERGVAWRVVRGSIPFALGLTAVFVFLGAVAAALGVNAVEDQFLLGGAFAVCAAPCIGPVLASILVLAGGSGTVLEGSVLLAAYALGLSVPFVIAAAVFTPAMGAFRWLRDHYAVIRTASGLVLVAVGLLLFFGRFWWIRVYVNRFFEWLGLG